MSTRASGLGARGSAERQLSALSGAAANECGALLSTGGSGWEGQGQRVAGGRFPGSDGVRAPDQLLRHVDRPRPPSCVRCQQGTPHRQTRFLWARPSLELPAPPRQVNQLWPAEPPPSVSRRSCRTSRRTLRRRAAQVLLATTSSTGSRPSWGRCVARAARVAAPGAARHARSVCAFAEGLTLRGRHLLPEHSLPD